MTAIELAQEGWISVEYSPPPSDMTVEFARDHRVHQQLPWFGTLKDLPMAFNVYGLYWRSPNS